nr:cmp-sialic acid transporter 4 [Quercus suber]
MVETLKCGLSLLALARIWRSEGVTEDNRIGIRAGGDDYEELVRAVSDDLRRRFPYGGANIVDGLTDQLEQFLRDGSAGVERSQEIHDGARRDFSDHRCFFLQPRPEFSTSR